jgi:hypothetical protein
LRVIVAPPAPPINLDEEPACSAAIRRLCRFRAIPREKMSVAFSTDVFAGGLLNRGLVVSFDVDFFSREQSAVTGRLD